jgi:alpha,alpha-trehalose phosphorylase (configuration-retaining)
MWAGIAGAIMNNNSGFEVAISIHDSVYNTDFSSAILPLIPNDPEAQASRIEEHIVKAMRDFSSGHLCKFLGAGVTVSLLRKVLLSGHFFFCLTDRHFFNVFAGA